MCTEVKIAAVIVIVLIGVGTIWYVGWGRKASQKGPEEIGQGTPDATEDEHRTFLADVIPDETASADAGTSSQDTGGPGTARVGIAGTGDSASSDLASAGVASDTSGTDTTGAETAARTVRPGGRTATASRRGSPRRMRRRPHRPAQAQLPRLRPRAAPRPRRLTDTLSRTGTATGRSPRSFTATRHCASC